MIAGFRPEHFEDAAVADERQTGGMKFKVTIDVVESMGSELYAYFDVQAKAAESEELAALAEDAGLGELPGAGSSGGATHVVARLTAEPAPTPARRSRSCSTPPRSSCLTPTAAAASPPSSREPSAAAPPRLGHTTFAARPGAGPGASRAQ